MQQSALQKCTSKNIMLLYDTNNDVARNMKSTSSFPWQDFLPWHFTDNCQIPWHFQALQTSDHPVLKG